MNRNSENIEYINAFAGYFYDEDKVISSSSGGAATALAEGVLEAKGVVYGATYSEDYYSAHYMRVTALDDLEYLKGSKYVAVRRRLGDTDECKSVYERAAEDLSAGRIVLFIGLGCDAAAIQKCCINNSISTDKLFCVELLCDGVTNEIVHEKYVKEIEKLHNSKVVSFSVRRKIEGWIPLYIYAELDNGENHFVPFYNTSYGYAFLNYKRKSCYSCVYKNENHKGDVIIGDYWGCNSAMNEYNRNGVSIIYVMNTKGGRLIEFIDLEKFKIVKTNTSYALKNSPRFFDCHPQNSNWDIFDKDIKEYGLTQAYINACKDENYEKTIEWTERKVVLWGAGKNFKRYAHFILEHTKVTYIVDNNRDLWGKTIGFDIVCIPPESLLGKDVFVILLIDNASAICQVVNELLTLGVKHFDHYSNVFKSDFLNLCNTKSIGI